MLSSVIYFTVYIPCVSLGSGVYSVTSGVESSSAACESAADSAGLVVEGVMTNATAGMDMRHLSPAIVAAVMQPQVSSPFRYKLWDSNPRCPGSAHRV